MSDSPKNMNRIPFESLENEGDISSWKIPTVASKKSRLVFSAKKDKQKQKDAPEGSELVEDYNAPVKPKALTAEALAKLAEEAKKEGYEQGYQEGLAKGLQDGTAKGQRQGEQKAYKDTHARITSEANTLNHIASNLLAPMQEQEGSLEKIIVDMAVHFAQGLLQDEISLQPKKLLKIIKHAITALPAGSINIEVVVSPHDAKLVEKHLPSNLRNWSVSIDDSIKPGGFRVETQESIVDYTIESRLRSFLDNICEQGDVEESQVAPVMELPEIEAPQSDESEAPKMAETAPDHTALTLEGNASQENHDQTGDENEPGDV
ncbi:MAG: flagellar assembly protein FliH [Agarilytica sp.]